MADALLPLSPAAPGGQIEDVEDLIGALATLVVRQRVQIAGAILSEIARVIDTDPIGTEFGLVTRNIAQRTAIPPAITRVAAAVADTSLLVANPARKNATFFNESPATGRLFLKLGAGASLISYTAMLVPGGYYELPGPVWVGAINGFWDVAGGFVQVTEII